MIIDISEVLMNTGRTRQYTVNYEASVFSYKMGDYEVISSEPFVIELTSPVKNKLRIKGSGSVVLAIPCDRCLKEVNTAIDFDIDEEVLIETDGDDEEEQCFVTSHFLDVDKMLYLEIMLNIPGKVLCREDCKGICTVCGCNLNDGECGCDRFVPDPRMSAINDIFEKFNKKS